MDFINKISFSFKTALVVLIVLMSCIQINAQTLVIAENSIWKFDDSGRNLGSSWNELIFSDNSWDSGPGILGYGEDDTNTEVSYGSDSSDKHITTYFRKTFSISNASQYKRLMFSLLRDDGAAVYLNGKLLFTSNMPDDFDYSTLASDGIGDEKERTYYDFIEATDYLVEGNNVIGVEVHQSSPSSSDLSFDLTLQLSAEDYGQIRINEIGPRNVSTYLDPDYKQFQDWIELYNPQPEDIDLENYYLSDDLNSPTKWKFPENSLISANGYLLISADGLNEGLHTSFRLSGAGERLVLHNPQLLMLDSISYPNISPDESFGILSNGARGYFGQVTPGEKNSTGYSQNTRASEATYSHVGGIYSGGITLELFSNEQGAEIRYSLNGENIDQNSDLYSSPIQISGNTVVKTKVFVPGILPSSTMVQSYLINVDHDLPVFSLTTDPDYLTSSDMGVYRDDDLTVRKLWDRPGRLEFFNTNGTREFSINIDYRLFGRGAVKFPQKSLAIFMRMTNGYDGLNYSLFPDSPVNHYQSFILRSSSDDWRNTMFRDGMIHSLLVDDMDLEYQDYRPSVLYINGKYYGIHNIRDKLNEAYLATHKGVDPQNVDILYVDNDYSPPNIEIKSGDDIAYWAMFNFITENDMSISSNYEKATDLIDMSNYQDYLSVEIISGNRSWRHNRRVWRPRSPDGKFRYMLFDLDYGYYNLDEDILDELKDTDKVFRSLVDNPIFRSGLMQKLALYSQSIFEESRVENRINNLAAAIESEIPRHADKWGPTYSGNFDNKAEWEDNVEDMLDFNDDRASVHEDYFQDFIDDPGRITASISSSPSSAGAIFCHNVKLENGQFNGFLYEDQYVILRAEPNLGYQFSGWSGSSLSSHLVDGYDWEISNDRIMNSEIILKGASNFSAIANYGSPRESDLVITELFYAPDGSQGGDDGEFIELINRGNQSINLSDYYFDNAISYTFPANSVISSGEIVLIAKNPARYLGYGVQIFEWSEGRLSDAGEHLILRDDNDDLFDEVNYLTTEPWPYVGEGYSIELSDFEVDNNSGYNWRKSSSYGGSPGTIDVRNTPNLVINEIVGMNGTQDYLGKTDWIEIFNAGSSTIDLAGLFVTDDISNPFKYQIPEGFPVLTSVAPGGYIILIAEGLPEVGPLSTSFKISGAAGYVGLYSLRNDGSFELIDGVEYPSLQNSKSYGRYPNGQGNFEVLNPSPAGMNRSAGFNISAPALVEPGDLLPVIIRITNEYGEIDRTFVDDLTLTSSIGTVEPSLIRIKNGVGSATVLFSATKDFVLSVEGYDFSRQVSVSNSIPVIELSGTIDETLTLLDGISYEIDNSITISEEGALIVQQGARLILGHEANVHVLGKMTFNGSAERPIVMMPKDVSSQWGGIDISNVEDTCVFNHTFFIYGASDESKMHGHSESQPLIRTENVIVKLDNCYFIDNVGKAIMSEFSRFFVSDCVFSRCDTGPEFEHSYAEVEDSWFIDIPDADIDIRDDDNDAMYFEGVHSSEDPPSLVDGCVVYGTEDDGIDTSAADLIVRNSSFSKNYEKGISAGWRSSVLVEYSVFYKNAIGVSSSFWTPLFVDHCTFVDNSKVVISYDGGGVVSNSILLDHKTTYSDDGDNYWLFNYNISDSDPDLLGTGNIYADPKLTDIEDRDFTLSSNSPAIDSGDPSFRKDADGSITDMGAFPYGAGSSVHNALVISEIHYNPIPVSGVSEQYEFIEISHNGSTYLDVSSYRIDDAISFSFPENTILNPGEVVIIAFEKQSYASINSRVFEWSDGKLSNGGELISLYSSDGQLIDQIQYDDENPWPTEADGLGFSLELSDLSKDNFTYEYWRASQAYGGSPGEPYMPVDYSKVKINEVFPGVEATTNTNKQYPWLEIFNDNINPLNLAHHRFINEQTEVLILSGGDLVVSGPKGFITIQYDPLSFPSLNSNFVNQGGEISLERFDGYNWILVDKLSISVIESGNSYGRYPDGTDSFQVFNLLTPGQANTVGSGNIITSRRVVDGDRLPVIVRLESVDDVPGYLINQNINMSSDNADFSEGTMTMVQGMGSLITTVSADDSFTLGFNEIVDTVGISVASVRHRFDVDKKIVFDQTWTAQHDYYVDHDLVVHAGVTLTIERGARVFITSKSKITIEGKLIINGIPADPVLFTSVDSDEPWGNIEFPAFSGGGDLNGVIFNNGGGDSNDFSPYTNSQAIIESNGTNVTLNNCFFVDNPGKAVYCAGADIRVRNSLVSETESGVLVQDGSLIVDNSWFQFIPDQSAVYTGDEHDALFVSTSSNGGASSITNSKFNNISDDAISAISASWLELGNLFFNSIGDKAVTINDSQANIEFVVISNSPTGIYLRGDAEATIDHSTFHQNDVHLKSYSSSDASSSSEIYVKNSILSNAGNADYFNDNNSKVEFDYSLSNRDELSGSGNLLAEPDFQDTDNRDFRLNTNSPAVDAGDPDSEYDNDGSRTDMGAFTGRETFSSVLVINEVMYAPKSGASTAEFIEIYNAGGSVVDLTNYSLNTAVEFTFPQNSQILPNEYIVITRTSSTYSGHSYQVFQWLSGDLSNDGDNINLEDSEGRLVDVVSYLADNGWPEQSVLTDLSIELKNPGLNNSSPLNWRSSYVVGGTPGKENSKLSSDGIVINELMARNHTVLQDETGEFVDWLELYNRSDSYASLDGLYLSRDQSNLQQYQISGSEDELLIGPHEYRIFWLDNQSSKGIYHTNFELAAAAGYVALSKLNGVSMELIDETSYTALGADVAFGRFPNGNGDWVVLNQPTPGGSNDIGSSKIAGLFINELLARNTSVYRNDIGEYDDWIELYNQTNQAIDIAGLYFSDDPADPLKSMVPYGHASETTIPSHGFLMLFPSARPESGPRHLDFQLAGGGEHIVMTQNLYSEVLVVDEVIYPALSTDISYGRQLDAYIDWKIFDEPTPNSSNGYNSVEELKLDSEMLSVYPNPVSDILSVSFTNDREYEYTIEIVSLLSQTIRILDQGVNIPAYSSVRKSYDSRELTSAENAVVILRIRINDKIFLRKLYVLRD